MNTLLTRPLISILILTTILTITFISCTSDPAGEDSDSDTDTGSASDSEESQDTETDTPSDDPAEGVDVFEVVDNMDACVNLGNWLEAPDQDWGVVCNEDDFVRIAEMGFDTVRMPVRWESRAMAEAPYTIDEEFLELVDDALTWASDAGLTVVMDMHHHDAMYADAVGTKDAFLAMWEQIATRYRKQPNTLIFEIMNEPHDTLTETLWNEYLVDALAVIRETNPVRPVVIGTANWGGIAAMSQLELPADDDNIIFTFHYYDPFQFTHQGASWSEGSDAWLGTTWSGTYLEKLQLKNDMATVASWAEENDVPVFLGEFGAYEMADMDSRAIWTEAVARFSESQNMAWCYWEYKAGFGVWDQDSESWNTPLTDALFSEDTDILDMTPTELGESILTNGDFEDGYTGWSDNFFDGTATSSVEDGVLTVDVTEVGDAVWGIQVINGLPVLEAGQSYAVLFEAWADAPRSLSVGVQLQEDPYTTYGYTTVELITEPKTFVLNLSMAEEQGNAGLVFNFGAAAGPVYLDNILLVVAE